MHDEGDGLILCDTHKVMEALILVMNIDMYTYVRLQRNSVENSWKVTVVLDNMGGILQLAWILVYSLIHF